MKVEVCNFWHQKCCIEVKKDEEVICPICDGHGGFLAGASFRNGHYKVGECPLCNGEGKVDWVTSLRKERVKFVETGRVKNAKIKCPANKSCKKIKRLWKNRERKSLGGFNVRYDGRFTY